MHRNEKGVKTNCFGSSLKTLKIELEELRYTHDNITKIILLKR